MENILFFGIIGRSMMPKNNGAPFERSVRVFKNDTPRMKQTMPLIPFCMICDMVDPNDITKSRDDGRGQKVSYGRSLIVMINKPENKPSEKALVEWGTKVADLLQHTSKGDR